MCAVLFIGAPVLFLRLWPFKKRGAKGLEKRGDISRYSSLALSLSGTLGVGNIVGTASAIYLGGAGAVFWMLLSVPFCAVLKYAEAYLSRLSRKEDSPGALGYISELKGGRELSIAFAALCVVAAFFIGSVIQTNSASLAASAVFNVPRIVTGAAFAVLTSAVVLGGLKRVTDFTDLAMPIFSVLYLSLTLIAVSRHANELSGIVKEMFIGAFTPEGFTSGALGSAVAAAIRHGIAKSVLSNEAGCGSSAFSHSSGTSSPEGQGRLGALEVFIDTAVFGGATALFILTAPIFDTVDPYGGADIAVLCARYHFGECGAYMLAVFMIFFAFASAICWAYYGRLAIGYLKKGTEGVFTLAYSVSSVIAAVSAPELIWELADTVTMLMLCFNTSCMLCHFRSFRMRL